MDSCPPSSGKVVFNIGGVRFETLWSTLRRLPGTKLARLSHSDASYDSHNDEFFYDRNPQIFPFILDLYRLGQLHFPQCICPSYIQQELDFWEICVDKMAECCLMRVRLANDQTLKSVYMERLLTDTDFHTGSSWHGNSSEPPTKDGLSLRLRLWQFMEDPSSSTGAKIWGVVFLVVVLVSVVIQCGMTSPAFRHPIPPRRPNATQETNPKLRMYLTTEVLPELFYLDIACLFVFILELVMRFLLCPHKLRFFMCAYNLIDLVSTSVMLFLFLYEMAHPDFWGNNTQFTVVYVMSAFSVFRVLRLIKFARQYHGVKLLLLALRSSCREILLLLIIFTIGTLIFSNMIYYAEFYSSENDFYSIPIGFWWAIVTMTTVGYGDRHPHSAWGYVVGAICAMSGMLCAALPIPIIANNFNLIYSYDRRRRLGQRHLSDVGQRSVTMAPSSTAAEQMGEAGQDKLIRCGNKQEHYDSTNKQEHYDGSGQKGPSVIMPSLNQLSKR